MAKATKAPKVPVTERALFARVSRALAKDGLVLKRCRADSRWSAELGYYYTVDATRNLIDSKHIDLVQWAREMKLLAEYEELV
jgi:hypothetical protein